MGKVGRNGLLYHSQYGSRLMLGAVLTTAELPETTWPQRDDQGCPEGCSACQERCPIGAISQGGQVDKLACLKRSMKSPLFSLLMKSGKIGGADAEMINQLTGVDDHSMYTCIECIAACPK